MNDSIQQYSEIILLICGFAFFLLSTVIYVLPKDNARIPLLPNLSLIALFAFLQGSHEFIEWGISRYATNNAWIDHISNSISLVSYFPLIEFGRGLFYNRKGSVLLSVPTIYGLCGFITLVIVLSDRTAMDGMMVASQLAIGFPGAILTGFALLSYANKETDAKLEYYLQITGGGFMVYGLSILVLPDSNSNFAQPWLTYTDFFAIIPIPILLIRAFSTLIIAASLTHIVRGINLRNQQSELAAIAEISQFSGMLELRVKKRTEKLHQLTNRLRLDIAERKQVERQREQFFKFFNLARDLQCIVNPEGFFTQLNPAFTKRLGFSKDELLQKPFIEFVAPEDRPPTLAEVKRLQNNEVTLDFENRYFCKDGTFCWLSWKAVFEPTDQLIYAVARDVTEHKKNQEKLQLAEMVYQHSIEAILVTDANNRIIAVNPAFTEITGYTLDEVLGKNPKIFKSDRQNQAFYQAMWQAINTQGHWQGEIWDKRKNGDLHAKFLSINSILNKEGRVHRYLALFSDITARKHYEDEIKLLSASELNKAKLEAEKANLAKSDFLSSMSHELRTPMNAVLGFAQLLEFEDLTRDQRDSVQQILTAGHHLLDLINQVLDLSRIESEKIDLKLEQTDLATFVQDCIALIQPLTLKNNIKIFYDMADHCYCSVLVDSLHLRQVLLNLLSNAIKYNRVDGSITLSCESLNPQTIRLNVIDTGLGLSELEIAKLFQPFERLSAKNSSIGGTGIGLCISKKLVEAMNGDIGVNSTVGEGSCFWVELPRA